MSNVYLILNFFHFSLFVIITRKYLNLDNNFVNLFIITSLPSIFLIGKFFNIHYMWDIQIYLDTLEKFRDFNTNFILQNAKTISFGFIYSVNPFFFIYEAETTGLVTRFFYFVFILFLFSKNIFKSNSFFLFFLMLSPSILLHTNLGLKEVILAIISSFVFISFIEKKYFMFFLLIVLLLILKPQNGYILILCFFIYFLIFTKKINKNYKFIIVLISILLIFINLDYIFGKFNFYRYELFLENSSLDDYEAISLNNFLKIYLYYFYNFTFSPELFLSSSFFKHIIFFENIFILFYVSILIFLAKQKKKVIILVLIVLFLSFSIYGLVTVNDGAIMRWRFPWLFSIIVFLNYFLIKNNIFFTPIKIIKYKSISKKTIK